MYIVQITMYLVIYYLVMYERIATVHACGLDNGMLRYFKIFERNLGVLFVKTLI